MRWLPVDVVLVVLFAVAGRASHEEGLTAGGIWHTAWPFLAGLALGWAFLLVRRLRPGAWTSGLLLWATTLIGGMVLRVATDAGAATPFIVVATVVTGALLVGSRLLVGIAARRLVGSGR
jgi:hypothetical protein